MDNAHTQCVAKHAHAMHTSDTGVNNNTLRVGLLTRHIPIVLAVVYLLVVVTSDLIVSIITNPYRNATHGVPKTSLHNRIKGKVVHGVKPGPKQYLSVEEEIELAEFAIEAASVGKETNNDK